MLLCVICTKYTQRTYLPAHAYILVLFVFKLYVMTCQRQLRLLYLCLLIPYRALGQGAFGEVYQGFFRHRVGDAVEMPVAVKVC